MEYRFQQGKCGVEKRKLSGNQKTALAQQWEQWNGSSEIGAVELEQYNGSSGRRRRRRGVQWEQWNALQNTCFRHKLDFQRCSLSLPAVRVDAIARWAASEVHLRGQKQLRSQRFFQPMNCCVISLRVQSTEGGCYAALK